MSKILVIASHDNEKLKPATLSVVGAAQKIGGEIDVLVCGNNANAVKDEAAKISGVSKVIYASGDSHAEAIAENISAQVLALASGYTHIMTSAGTTGKDFLPRVAAGLGVGQISEIIEVIDEKTFKRPIYAGNAIETVQTQDAVKVITVRATAFEKVGTDGAANVEEIAAVEQTPLTKFKEKQVNKSDRPELTTASIVISGGRGVGSAQGFEVIEKLATKLGAAVGASRAAVDAGFVPNDYQVGQTGKIVAPDLYIAAGISGAIQHLAGMKESKVIVAINKDESAPIFDVADYGLVADLFEAVPEIESKL